MRSRSPPPGIVRALAIGLLVSLLLAPGGVPLDRTPAAFSGGASLSAPAPEGVDGARPATGAASGPLAAMTLSVLGTSPTALDLNWTPTASLTFSSYTVFYSTAGATGPWQSAAILTSQSTTTFSLDGLAPGAAYWWQVAENDALLGTQYSNVVAETQPALAALTAWLYTSSDVQLNWTNNASYGGAIGFVSYGLFEVAGTAPPSAVATLSTVGTRTATVTGLTPGGSYRFYLNTTDCFRACGTAGAVTTGSESNAVTLGTPLALSATVGGTRVLVDVGQLDLFVCTPSGGQSPYAFAWDLGNGTFVPGPSTVSATFASAGTATVTCRVTDALASQATSAFTVTVAPDPEVGVVVAPTAVDAGQLVHFDCTPALGAPPYLLTWTFGDGQSAGINVTTHTYTIAGTFVATCLVTDATGTSASALATVEVSPPLVVRVGANSSAAAPGTTLTFAALAANGSGVYVAFNWSFGDGAFANLSTGTTSHAFAAPGNFTVAVEVTDTHAASAVATTVVHVSDLNVTVGPLAASVVAGGAVGFSAAAQGGAGGPYLFTWQFGDGDGLVGASVEHAYRSAGTYHPTLTVSDRLGASRTIALPAISVSGPASTPLVSADLLLLFGVVAGVGAAGIAEGLRRRESDRAYALVAGRVPSAGPSRLVGGRKVCRSCGHTNLALRETCEACGASLRLSRSR